MKSSRLFKALKSDKTRQAEIHEEPQPFNRRRSTPVPDRVRTYYLGKAVLEETRRIIDAHARKTSEALVFWAGATAGDTAYVATCYYPMKSATRYGGVKVALKQMTKINLELAARDQIILCQVHSHPGLALQSDVDEKRAVTYHHGFISIVVPEFDGAAINRLQDCGVYEYSDGKWRALDQVEIRRRFIVEESLVEV